jgi:hypothetical protein
LSAAQAERVDSATFQIRRWCAEIEATPDTKLVRVRVASGEGPYIDQLLAVAYESPGGTLGDGTPVSTVLADYLRFVARPACSPIPVLAASVRDWTAQYRQLYGKAP